jgi:predicted lactoylglutathione lyase
MPTPTASDVRVFVPAKDFSLSKAFYRALGWKLNWEDAELAELEIAGHRFLLQNYYKQEWADNFMIHVSIDDAQAWYELASSILAAGAYLGAKVSPPAQQSYGALVTHLWDPSGVLLHLAQWNVG